MAKLLTQFEKWCPWCLFISSLYLLRISLTRNTKLSSLRNDLHGTRKKIHWKILEKCSDRKTWQSYMYYGHTHTKTLKRNKDNTNHATNNKCAGWGQDTQRLGFPQSLQVLSNRFEAYYWWTQTICSCSRKHHKNNRVGWLSLRFCHRPHMATPPEMTAASHWTSLYWSQLKQTHASL